MKSLPGRAGFHVYDKHNLLWSVYHQIPWDLESTYGAGSELCIFIDCITHRHTCSYIKFDLYFSCNLLVDFVF